MGLLENKLLLATLIGTLVVGGGAYYAWSVSPNKQLVECLKIVEEGQEDGEKILLESELPDVEKYLQFLKEERGKQIDRCHRLFGD